MYIYIHIYTERREKEIQVGVREGAVLLTYSLSLSWKSPRALRGLNQLVFWEQPGSDNPGQAGMEEGRPGWQDNHALLVLS